MRELEQGRKKAPVKKDVKTEKEKAKETEKAKEKEKAKRPYAGGAMPVCPVSKTCGGCQLLHIPYGNPHGGSSGYRDGEPLSLQK